MVRWLKGDGEMEDPAPDCSALPGETDQLNQKSVGNYINSPLSNSCGPLWCLVYAHSVFFYSCKPHCGDSVPLQGQIRRKDYPSLFFSSLKLLFVLLSLCWIQR